MKKCRGVNGRPVVERVLVAAVVEVGAALSPIAGIKKLLATARNWRRAALPLRGVLGVLVCPHLCSLASARPAVKQWRRNRRLRWLFEGVLEKKQGEEGVHCVCLVSYLLPSARSRTAAGLLT